MALLALYAICLLVGFLVGGTGMGGILIPPALVLLTDLGTHTAMGTTLASFIPMNIAGIILYGRKGHIPWLRAVPLLAGGMLSAAPCAYLNVYCNGAFLTLLLACLVFFSGVNTFRPPRRQNASPFWQKSGGLFCIGFVTGTAAGLTGAGGPLLAIAWMITVSIHPLTAVGLSMPYSLATALAATVFNHFNGSLDLPLLTTISTLELFAFLLGYACITRLPVLWIKRLMGATCLALGLFLFVKTLLLDTPIPLP